MRLKNHTAKITFDIPEECNPDEIAAFIESALSSWGGGGDPDDPLFHSLKVHSVEFGGVKYVKESE